MPMQDPQSYEDDDGNVYVREGNRYRVIRPGQAAPQAPALGGGYTLQPMETPAQRAQAEERQYDRGRDIVRDQLTDAREARAIAAAERQAEAQQITNEKLTEDQGKAGGYAQLMADAEQSYQQALREGFNPTGFRAGLANFTDNIPLMGGVGNFIRDDAGDRARQAELQWSDAQLKAMSGAASPEPEVVRNQITNFARPGQNYGYIGERLEDARRTAFESARRRAGRDLQGLAYPDTDAGELPIRDLQPGETPEALAASGRVRGSDGVWRYPRDADGNPIFPENGGGAPPAGGGDPGPLEQRATEGYQTALAQERANADLIRPAAGVDMGLQFTAPFNDELAYAAGFLGQGAGNIGRRLTGRDIEVSADERGRASQDVMRQDQDRFARERPAQNIAANVLGGAALGPGANGLNTVRLMTQGGGVGAAYGAASAEGGLMSRGRGALVGGGTGAALGAAARPVGQAAGFVADRLVVRPARAIARAANRASGGRLLNPDREAANRIAQAMQDDGFNPQTIRQAVDDWNTNGGPSPSLLDIVSQNGGGQNTRALLRGAAMAGPARNTAAQYNNVIEGNIQPSAINRTRELTPETRTTGQVNTALDDGRSAQAELDYGGPYRTQVPVGPEVTSALSGGPGRAALLRARTAAVARRNQEQVDEIDRLLAAPESGPFQPVSAGTLDRTRIAMARRGRNLMTGSNANPDIAGGLFQRADDIDGALSGIPQIQPARETYQRFSQGMGGLELGATVRNAAPDQFAADLAASPGAQWTAPTGAARAIEEGIGRPAEGSTGALNTIATSTNMRRNLTALFGEQDAARYQAAINQIVERVQNARFINPNTGSQSMGRAVDESLVEGVPTSTTGALLQIFGKIARGATLTDAERSAIVRLGTGSADAAPAPRVSVPMVPRMVAPVSAQSSGRDRGP